MFLETDKGPILTLYSFFFICPHLLSPGVPEAKDLVEDIANHSPTVLVLFCLVSSHVRTADFISDDMARPILLIYSGQNQHLVAWCLVRNICEF